MEEPDPMYTYEFFKSKDVQRVYDKYAKACYEHEKRIRQIKSSNQTDGVRDEMQYLALMDA